MNRYVEMDDTATLAAQDHEHVENLETDRWHGEEVNRHQGLDVILQEGSPGLGGRSATANHVLADAFRTPPASRSGSCWVCDINVGDRDQAAVERASQ
jgi:hypothetical protein